MSHSNVRKENVCSVAQSGLTLCNPTDYSLPGSSVRKISQARILEWVAISFSISSSIYIINFLVILSNIMIINILSILMAPKFVSPAQTTFWTTDLNPSLINIYTWIIFQLFQWTMICTCSVVSDTAIPWTVAHQAPLSMEFSRQEYWSGLPFLTSDLPDPVNACPKRNTSSFFSQILFFFNITIDGNNILSPAQAKTLGIHAWLLSFASFQSISKSKSSIKIYPEFCHFSPPLPLLLWYKPLSSLTQNMRETFSWNPCIHLCHHHLFSAQQPEWCL